MEWLCTIKQGRFAIGGIGVDGLGVVPDRLQQGHVRVYKHANIIEGHIMPDKPKKRRGK